MVKVLVASKDKSENKHRSGLKHNFKAKQSEFFLSLKSPSAALINSINLLREECAMDFRYPAGPHDDMQCQKSSDCSSLIDDYFMDVPSTALVPQSYWDDLFDKALLALNTVPIEDELQHYAT